MRKTLLYLAVLIVNLSPIVACSAPPAYQVKQVAAGIFYHQGVNEDASEQNIGAIANVGFIIGKKCVAVIDSGGSYLEGSLLHKALRRHTDLPICYVINTHVHPDHILGNAAFKNDHPHYVGHERLAAAMAARKTFFATSFKKILGKAYKGSEFIPPDQTVKIGEPLTIDLGDRPLILTAYPTAHTDNDLTVMDQQTKTLWTGDLLFINRIPAIDGSINGWIANIGKLAKLDVNTVIPGHGPAGQHQWQQSLQAELSYLTLIRAQIRTIIAKLGTIDEATAKVGLQQRDKWKLFDQYNRRNVTAAFAELEWE